MSRNALLYTEMISTSAIVRGDAEHLLAFNAAERPVALQLGGSDPEELATAARVAVEFGYDEINLNAGCPSKRVFNRCFGAALMTEPGRAAECVKALVEAANGIEVTVKCRIGVDDQISEEALPRFFGSGCFRRCEENCRSCSEGVSQRLKP